VNENRRLAETVGRQPAELAGTSALAVAVDDLRSLERPFRKWHWG